MKHALALLLALCAPASAGDAPDADAKTIRLIVLTPGSTMKAGEGAAIAAEATRLLGALAPGLRVALVPGNPAKLDFASLDNKVTVAVIGKPENVRIYLHKKDPKNSDYLKVHSWNGGVDNPECSQHDWEWDHKVMGGRLIAIDSESLDRFGGKTVADAEHDFGWTKVQAGALILAHGAGHNSDKDNKIGDSGDGIMADGQARVHNFKKAVSAYAVTTAPANQYNKLMGDRLKARFK
jgi:hypothetical protein